MYISIYLYRAKYIYTFMSQKVSQNINTMIDLLSYVARFSKLFLFDFYQLDYPRLIIRFIKIINIS